MWAVGSALSLVLSAALSLALLGCGVASSRQPSGATTPAQATASTSGWATYRDPVFGFIVEVPHGATSIGATATGATSLASWRLPDPQGGADAATLEVTATTQASAGICAHYASGKPVSLAGGAIGYQQDNLSAPTPATAVSQPQITVVTVRAGLLTILTLTGQGDPGIFAQRWSGVWSHILASFQPGRGPAGAQPCG